jgi:hypothetical protein
MAAVELVCDADEVVAVHDELFAMHPVDVDAEDVVDIHPGEPAA